MYGDAATKQNDWAFHYLPKIDRNYSWTQIWDNMYRGTCEGDVRLRHERRDDRPGHQKNIEALKKADWLVVGEIYPDETSEFWRAPGITAEEMKNIKTTVYRLPCAGFAEKDGSMTNSARWLQWKNVALPPPGDARLDQDIVAQIFLRVRELYKKEGGKFPDPILNCHLGLHRSRSTRRSPKSRRKSTARRSPTLQDPDDRARRSRAGQQLPGFAWLKDDGTTVLRQLDLLRFLDRGGPLNSRAAARKIPPASASIRTGPGRGRRIAACSTTAPPAISTASRGIHRGGRSGGTKAPRNGSATTFPISRPIRIPRTTWGRSS